MAIYYLTCLASMVLAYVSQHLKNKSEIHKNRVTVLLTSAPYILVAAFRYKVGTDYLAYTRLFHSIANGQSVSTETLFVYLNKIVFRFHGSEYTLLAITAIITLLLIFNEIVRDSPSVVFSAFLFFAMSYYFESLNIVRQAIACAIVLFSIRYIEEENILKFILCNLIAVGFHSSCVVFLIVYLFTKKSITPKTMIIGSAIVVICRHIISKILVYIISFTEYSHYIDSQFDNGQSYFISFAIQLVILFLATWQYDYDDKKYRLYYSIQTVATWLGVFSQEVVLIRRLRWMFALPAIILLPMAIKNISNKKSRWIVIIITCISFIIYIHIITTRGKFSVLPYQTWL